MFAVPAIATAARAFRAAGVARPVMRAVAASHVATTPFQAAAPTHRHGARCFSAEVFKGSCHCGECQVEVDGVPNAGVICHCSICRLCHSAPYAELLAYDNDKVRVVKGEDKMKMYNIHGKSQEDRYFCPDCGSKVYSVLNHLGCKAVFLQNFTEPNHGSDGKIDPRFKPSMHIFYGSGTINVFDGLPKYETMPAALGGDDKQLPEDHH